jgi:predicted TPR repeat methyltransferase
LSVAEEAFDGITKFQEAELFPLLQAQLSSRTKRVLDYGCGAGRFSAALRELTDADFCVGFDLCPELIAMAQSNGSDPRTHFVTGTPRQFFRTLQCKFDLIWIATVLGGIPDSDLTTLAGDLASALARGGLLFFAENTAPEDPANTFWRSRPVAWYERLFSARGIRTGRVGAYTSCGTEVSVFAGKKGA